MRPKASREFLKGRGEGVAEEMVEFLKFLAGGVLHLVGAQPKVLYVGPSHDHGCGT